MLAVARALKHGFVVFFKAWPDTNYDLVIDYNGELFRVEVKGSSGKNLNLTRGQRRGRQIDPTAPSRERKVARKDCDVVLGVDAQNGDCYVLPIDYAERWLGKAPSFKSIARFRERWDLLKGNRYLSKESCRRGIRSWPRSELMRLAAKLRLSRAQRSKASDRRLVKLIYEAV